LPAARALSIPTAASKIQLACLKLARYSKSPFRVMSIRLLPANWPTLLLNWSVAFLAVLFTLGNLLLTTVVIPWHSGKVALAMLPLPLGLGFSSWKLLRAGRVWSALLLTLGYASLFPLAYYLVGGWTKIGG